MMSDDVWKRDEVHSPCIKICVIHPEARLCTGCLRSIDEIATWSQMTNDGTQRRDGRVAHTHWSDHQTTWRARGPVGKNRQRFRIRAY